MIVIAAFILNFIVKLHLHTNKYTNIQECNINMDKDIYLGDCTRMYKIHYNAETDVIPKYICLLQSTSVQR